MTKEIKIGFIGGGNMATALIGGLANKVTPGSAIHVIDLKEESLQKLSAQFGVTTSLTMDEKLARCDVLVLAVKPQQIREAVRSLMPQIKSQLILSIAAGISTSDLSRWLGGYNCIVRTMPNTPALIGKGMTGLFALPSVLPEQRQIAETIVKAVGEAVWVEKEDLLNTVTAISGSGPAYVFYFIESLAAASEKLGLTKEQSLKLALATFSGSSELALQSEDSVEILREKVTSPGGTTFAALTVMQNKNIKETIIKAAQAAAKRSIELGEEFGKTA